MSVKKIILLLLFLLCFRESIAINDTCLKIAQINCPCFGYINPDSVMINGCDTTDEQFYAKKNWRIIFKRILVQLPVLPRDSIIIYNNKELDSILALNVDNVDLRNFFRNLQSDYRNYYLRRVYPDVIDSTSWASRAFNISFDNYYPWQEIENKLIKSGLFEFAYYQNALMTFPEKFLFSMAGNFYEGYPSFSVKVRESNSYSYCDWTYKVSRRYYKDDELPLDLKYYEVKNGSDALGSYKLYRFTDSSFHSNSEFVFYRICVYSIDSECFGPCDSLQISIPTAIEQIGLSSDLKISPNPAIDYIEINVGAGSKPALIEDIRIYDMLGIEVICGITTPPAPSQEGVRTRIDVSSLPAGMYFVSVGNEVRKFIKL